MHEVSLSKMARLHDFYAWKISRVRSGFVDCYNRDGKKRPNILSYLSRLYIFVSLYEA